MGLIKPSLLNVGDSVMTITVCCFNPDVLLHPVDRRLPVASSGWCNSEKERKSDFNRESESCTFQDKQALQSHQIPRCRGLCGWITGLFYGDAPRFWFDRIKKKAKLRQSNAQQSGQKRSQGCIIIQSDGNWVNLGREWIQRWHLRMTMAWD